MTSTPFRDCLEVPGSFYETVEIAPAPVGRAANLLEQAAKVPIFKCREMLANPVGTKDNAPARTSALANDLLDGDHHARSVQFSG